MLPTIFVSHLQFAREISAQPHPQSLPQIVVLTPVAEQLQFSTAHRSDTLARRESCIETFFSTVVSCSTVTLASTVTFVVWFVTLVKTDTFRSSCSICIFQVVKLVINSTTYVFEELTVACHDVT